MSYRRVVMLIVGLVAGFAAIFATVPAAAEMCYVKEKTICCTSEEALAAVYMPSDVKERAKAFMLMQEKDECIVSPIRFPAFVLDRSGWDGIAKVRPVGIPDGVFWIPLKDLDCKK